MHIAVNAWGVARNPDRPCSLAILEWIERLAAQTNGIGFSLILPEGDASGIDLPAGARIEVVPTRTGASGRLWFEQWLMASHAAHIGADLLVDFGGRAPLRSPVPPQYAGWLGKTALPATS